MAGINSNEQISQENQIEEQVIASSVTEVSEEELSDVTGGFYNPFAKKTQTTLMVNSGVPGQPHVFKVSNQLNDAMNAEIRQGGSTIHNTLRKLYTGK